MAKKLQSLRRSLPKLLYVSNLSSIGSRALLVSSLALHLFKPTHILQVNSTTL